MYHAIVRRKVEKLFEGLGRRDVDYAVAGMAPRFEHIFPGDHTLGGVRHTRPGIRAWLERLFRVLPGLRFEIKHIAVSGTPWNTTVVVAWRDYATLADGTPYVNDGAHAIRLAGARSSSCTRTSTRRSWWTRCVQWPRQASPRPRRRG